MANSYQPFREKIRTSLMIAEIIPEAYDAAGRQVSQPFVRRKGPHPTFPMGRYVSQPLTVKCNTMREVRKFLASCEYVSDKELFSKKDYWQPPEEFEKRRKGDCEELRLVDLETIAQHGLRCAVHRWRVWPLRRRTRLVEFFQDGKCFLVEPQLCRVGDAVPRLSSIRYVPKVSVSWNGNTLRYFSHKRPEHQLRWQMLVPLVAEYVIFWAWVWLRILLRLPQIAWRILRRSLLQRRL